LLQNTIPVEKITGILVMHAESFHRSAGTYYQWLISSEEHHEGITIATRLDLSKVRAYLKDTLERKRADVVELAQNLTDNMNDIHGAIVQCMTITLAELRRSTVEVPAYFSSFDHIVRKQLDPIWLKVGPSTKALVRDLGVLRRLISYLLSFMILSSFIHSAKYSSKPLSLILLNQALVQVKVSEC
ncbi:hypothetical protein C8R42DRAFT_596379, partial [Lentinula raphanica]